LEGAQAAAGEGRVCLRWLRESASSIQAHTTTTATTAEDMGGNLCSFSEFDSQSNQGLPPELLPVNSPNRHERSIKVIIVGDVGVGKTSVCSRFIHDNFSQQHVSTIGAAFATLQVDLRPPVQMQLWDTAGEERFRAMTRFYFRDTAVALLVYDVGSAPSFAGVASWAEDLRAVSPNAKIVLVANKCDLVPGAGTGTDAATGALVSSDMGGTLSPRRGVVRALMHLRVHSGAGGADTR
jgi:small GTP-binding protein